jgi:hypothetical protein
MPGAISDLGSLSASPCRLRGFLKGFCKILIAKRKWWELADTPSDTITLAILYKLLILQLLHFASVNSSEPPKDGQ